MLTCDCGAYFEVRDAQPGQELNCPECHHPVKVPARLSAAPRTSGLALASLVLALVGAFTVVGTLAAVVAGVAALLHIAHHRPRFKGAALASAGIALGAVFTLLTLAALLTRDQFGLGGKMRELSMASLIDTRAGPEDDLKYKECSLPRPSEQWRKVRNNRSDDPAVYDVQANRDLVLLNPARHAYLDVRVDDKVTNNLTLDHDYRERVLDDFRAARQRGRAIRVGPGGQPGAGPEDVVIDDWGQPVVRDLPPAPSATQVKTIDSIPGPDGQLEGREIIIDVRRGGQPWRFIVHIYRRSDAFQLDPKKTVPVYVVRGYTPTRFWEQNERELREAMEKFRVGPKR